MAKAIHRVTTVVKTIRQTGADVAVFELVDPDEWKLPPFEAGAHVDVHTPAGAVRQYSLLGSPAEDRSYRIAVRREGGGRGGSKSMHDEVFVGSTLLVSLPRNHFPIRSASKQVMIAGGIGVTPFLSMMSTFRSNDVTFELHYATRSKQATPFLRELESATHGSVTFYHSDEGGRRRLDLSKLIDAAKRIQDTQLYCCGPRAMVDEVLSLGEDLGERLQVERFGQDATSGGSGEAYEIELAKSGRNIAVSSGQSMLAALRGAGVDVAASCEAGVCLECKTRYLAGSPVHKDLLMLASDRREYLTVCVSGCSSPKIVLDL